MILIANHLACRRPKVPSETWHEFLQQAPVVLILGLTLFFGVFSKCLWSRPVINQQCYEAACKLPFTRWIWCVMTVWRSLEWCVYNHSLRWSSLLAIRPILWALFRILLYLNRLAKQGKRIKISSLRGKKFKKFFALYIPVVTSYNCY